MGRNVLAESDKDMKGSKISFRRGHAVTHHRAITRLSDASARTIAGQIDAFGYPTIALGPRHREIVPYLLPAIPDDAAQHRPPVLRTLIHFDKDVPEDDVDLVRLRPPRFKHQPARELN